MMRWIFIVAGLIGLVASTQMAVSSAGGLAAHSAWGLIAMGVFLAVGAAAIGQALTRKHYGIAIVVGLGMLAGEVGAMLQTAQRVTAAREAQRAPLAAIAESRTAAEAELEAAQKALPKPVPSARLDLARVAQTTAEQNVAKQAAEKGCRENCRLLLQAAVDAAQREVENARLEMSTLEAAEALTIVNRLDRAKAAVKALAPPQSTTPLADNTGIPEWVLDVVEALTLSLAINLPASALIALGIKMRPAESTHIGKASKAEPIDATSISPRDHAVRFGLDVLTPDDGSLPVTDLHRAYLAWCGANGHRPFTAREIGEALLDLFSRTGVAVRDVDGRAHVIGARIRSESKRVLGPMTTIGVNA